MVVRALRSNFSQSILALLLLAGCARFRSRPLVPAETAAKFETRTLSDSAFKDFLEKNLRRPLTPWPPQSWGFETLSWAALYYHPSLALARAQWQTVAAGQRTAAARLNPTLGLAPGYDLSASGGLSPWFPAVTLDVPLETAGKRGYRKAQARHLSDSARLNMAATAWQLRSHLRLSLIDFSAVRQREMLLRDQLSIQEGIVHSLEQRRQAGAVSSQEVTLLRIAQEKVRVEWADAQRLLAEARVRVAEAVGLPAKALEGVDVTYDLSAPAPSDLISAEARDRALESRADLLGLLAEYAASQSALQLEIAKQYPNIHLGPGYQYDQGDHKFSLAVTAELPLLNQNQGPIAEAEARRAEVAARFQALQAKVISDIDRAVAVYRTTASHRSALESLAAAQEKRHAAVDAQVKAGAADQLDLLNSRMEWAASRLLELEGRVRFHQALAALEDALQRPADFSTTGLIEPTALPQAMKETKP